MTGVTRHINALAGGGHCARQKSVYTRFWRKIRDREIKATEKEHFRRGWSGQGVVGEKKEGEWEGAIAPEQIDRPRLPTNRLGLGQTCPNLTTV